VRLLPLEVDGQAGQVSAYREPHDREHTLVAGPISIRTEPNGGFTAGPITRVEREVTLDGHYKKRIGIWNAQRGGRATMAVGLDSVITREMWNAYKEAVEELWVRWDEVESGAKKT
jgi:hypothetical protein